MIKREGNDGRKVPLMTYLLLYTFLSGHKTDILKFAIMFRIFHECSF